MDHVLIFYQGRTKVINGSVVHNGSIHVPGSLFVKGLFGGRNVKIPDDLIILTKDAHFNGTTNHFYKLILNLFIVRLYGCKICNHFIIAVTSFPCYKFYTKFFSNKILIFKIHKIFPTFFAN